MRTRGNWGQTEGPWGRQRGTGEDRGELGNRGRPGRGQGALTETGEHRGSWQRPHKTRDFEKNHENPQNLPTCLNVVCRDLAYSVLSWSPEILHLVSA